MSSSYDAVEGDTGTTLRFIITGKSTNNVIDLTGDTVTLKWVGADGLCIERIMTIDDAAAGVVSYKFLADELYPPRMTFDVKVTDALGMFIHNVYPNDIVLKIKALSC